jgi:hypothetical protein
MSSAQTALLFDANQLSRGTLNEYGCCFGH